MFAFPAAGGGDRILCATDQTDLEEQSSFLSDLFLGSISDWHIFLALPTELRE